MLKEKEKEIREKRLAREERERKLKEKGDKAAQRAADKENMLKEKEKEIEQKRLAREEKAANKERIKDINDMRRQVERRQRKKLSRPLIDKDKAVVRNEEIDDSDGSLPPMPSSEDESIGEEKTNQMIPKKRLVKQKQDKDFLY